MQNTRSAFIVRVNPNDFNNLPDTLYRNQVSIGWAYLEPDNFMNDNDEERLKLIKKELQREYPGVTKAKEINYFFSIKKGDLILIPDPAKNRKIYFAIASDDQVIISNNDEDIKNDRRFRRNIIWLNNKQPISYNSLPDTLRSHLKQQTVKKINKSLPEIFEALLRETESKSLNTLS